MHPLGLPTNLPEHIVLNIATLTASPAGKQAIVFEVLSGFVEIGQVTPRGNIATLLEHATDPTTRAKLESLVSNYKVGQPPTSSMLDLLEKYLDIDLPLGIFIGSLPPMRLRQYSISS
ncbi:hypothetical protein FRC06_006407, partial [Ceratobasidium sp. 370]